MDLGLKLTKCSDGGSIWCRINYETIEEYKELKGNSYGVVGSMITYGSGRKVFVKETPEEIETSLKRHYC